MAKNKVRRCEWCNKKMTRRPKRGTRRAETEREFAIRKFCGQPCSKDSMLSKRHRELQSLGKLPPGIVRRIKRRA